MHSFWGRSSDSAAKQVTDGVQLNSDPIARHQPTATATVGMRRCGERPQRGYGDARTRARQESPSTQVGSAISHGALHVFG